MRIFKITMRVVPFLFFVISSAQAFYINSYKELYLGNGAFCIFRFDRWVPFIMTPVNYLESIGDISRSRLVSCVYSFQVFLFALSLLVVILVVYFVRTFNNLEEIEIYKRDKRAAITLSNAVQSNKIPINSTADFRSSIFLCVCILFLLFFTWIDQYSFESYSYYSNNVHLNNVYLIYPAGKMALIIFLVSALIFSTKIESDFHLRN